MIQNDGRVLIDSIRVIELISMADQRLLTVNIADRKDCPSNEGDIFDDQKLKQAVVMAAKELKVSLLN
jgi:hypothetical protein